jgi:hypothetical protein
VKSAPSASAGGSSTQANWKRLDYDVEGEWGFYLILNEFLKSSVESRRATAGWAGDRFAVYEGPKGEVLIASLSTWDTENDAREFFDAYVKRTELHYPGATVSDTKSTLFRLVDPEEGTVAVDLRGDRVLVIEGVPNNADANSMLNLLWK